MPLSAQLQSGLDLHRQGCLDEAQAIYEGILSQDPANVGALRLMGVIALQRGWHSIAPPLKDFADTAALIETLDQVITIDTAVAHLSGALAKPTTLLLHANADWRWLQGRSDSPWYPTVRIYRQDVAGDWSGVLRDLGRETPSDGR
jgi:hypothetical protein